MKQLLTSVAISAITAAAVSYGVATTQAPKGEEGLDTQIIVETTIKENPELIMNSIRDWQQAQKNRTREQMGAQVKEYHDAIYDVSHSGTVGPEDAPLTIVEFFDYNCPACKSFFKNLEMIFNKPANEGKLRVIFREFPIFGEQSEQNARLALAIHAVAPEKYFPWHKLMMEHQGRADMAFALAAADEVGLDSKALLERMEGEDISEALIADLELARSLGLPGTPSLIIGDMVVTSGISAQELQMTIDAVVAKFGDKKPE